MKNGIHTFCLKYEHQLHLSRENLLWSSWKHLTKQHPLGLLVQKRAHLEFGLLIVMISFPRWLKQRINYIEKSSKEHTELFETQNQLTIASRNDSLFRSAPIGSRFASHLNQNRTSELVSRVIWIRTGLQSSFRESFESEQDFRARFASHLNHNRTSELVSRVIWIRTGLQSSFRESFESEQDFKARFAVIWIITGLQSSFRESFDSEQDFKARFASHLIQNGTSKLVSRVPTGD